MKAALIGYGKMGREIERLLISRGHAIQLIIDIDNTGDLTPENLRGCDVAIEFSAPSAAFSNVCRCIEAGIPVVCGTTAWLDRLEEVKELCAKNDGAFFYASNYSIGVNLTFRINRMLSQMMNSFPDYDVTIEETHHTQKKDAPSGTAITLAEDIVASLDRKRKWVGEPTITPDHLGVTSVRRSVVPGTHVVTYESAHDYITLTHCAKSRDGFVEGAVAAAEFLAGKRGVFTMDDLLKFD